MEITMPPTTKVKKHIGRAPNYSPEYYMMMAKQIVDDGITYRAAAKIYGVSHGTVHHWLKLYRQAKIPCQGDPAPNFSRKATNLRDFNCERVRH